MAWNTTRLFNNSYPELNALGIGLLGHWATESVFKEQNLVKSHMWQELIRAAILGQIIFHLAQYPVSNSGPYQSFKGSKHNRAIME